MNKLRWKLSYTFLDWGLRLIPDPLIRSTFEMAVGTAGDVVRWQREQEKKETENEQLGFDFTD